MSLATVGVTGLPRSVNQLSQHVKLSTLQHKRLLLGCCKKRCTIVLRAQATACHCNATSTTPNVMLCVDSYHLYLESASLKLANKRCNSLRLSFSEGLDCNRWLPDQTLSGVQLCVAETPCFFVVLYKTSWHELMPRIATLSVALHR